jgi:KaiC/GvpD/RAD55 family RecA-like ATPase
MATIERMPSGIPGLDRNIEMGFPHPMVLIIEGEPGTGKSTLALQMLFNRCEGRERIYFSGITEPVENIRRYMSRYKFFKWEYVQEGEVHFVDIGHAIGLGQEARLSPSREVEIQLGEPFETILQKIRQYGPDMVVIDPLLTSYSQESLKYRTVLFEFLKVIRELGTFTIIVKEFTPVSSRAAENYMADGVLTMGIRPLQDIPTDYRNIMRISKLRGTQHIKKLLQIEMDASGMSVVPLEQYIMGKIP